MFKFESQCSSADRRDTLFEKKGELSMRSLVRTEEETEEERETTYATLANVPSSLLMLANY